MQEHEQNPKKGVFLRFNHPI